MRPAAARRASSSHPLLIPAIPRFVSLSPSLSHSLSLSLPLSPLLYPTPVESRQYKPSNITAGRAVR